MNPQKIPLSIILIIAVVGGITYLNSQKAPRATTGETVEVNTGMKRQEKSARYEPAKEITTPNNFINTNGKPITIGEFVGKKVVLIDFWTYSCINCQRTTPYLNAWHEKYKDKGLVIIGIHTPEFEFEKVYQNVVDATKRLGIEYPVVLDNDYSTWNAYQNRFWPRKYLIDIDGFIVYDHIGEGAYEETEKKIQDVLAERMTALGEHTDVNLAVTKETTEVRSARSPETYFGAARNQHFGSGSPGVLGVQLGLTVPTRPARNTLYLSGDWNLSGEFAENSTPNARIVYKFNSKDVFLVAESAEEIIVEVLLDGQPLGAEAGVDIIGTTNGKTILTIKKARLYTIIQGTQSETHTLELKILKPGLKAFAFTFG
jgi:thiol-disulfide isomerase/thioredoxin